MGDRSNPIEDDSRAGIQFQGRDRSDTVECDVNAAR